MIKWILGVIGFFIFRLPGAFVGFLLGGVIESLFNMNNASGKTTFRNPVQRNVSPADFELNLLSLCSLVIKADGVVNQTELDYVRKYFVSTSGKEKANAIFRTFNDLIKQREISTQLISSYLASRTRYEMRLQLLHFLFGIAQADGSISALEINKIREIAGYFRVNYRDFESIQAMFIKKAGTAYKILEIDKTATNDEIKKAYRTMVKKYHPDKVITQDTAIKKGAEEKFRQVQNAYEQLQKERGF
jgi:DnaJ like chaperone protein